MRSDPSYRVPVILPSPRSALLVPFVLAASVMLATTSGCTAPPEPEPTRTPLFATDEDAYAAAEEVYREYMEALDARSAGLPSPEPQDFLIGSAVEADIDGERFFDEQGLHLLGSMSIASFSGTSAHRGGADASVSAFVCLNAANVRVIDADGVDVTPAERGDLVAQSVDFIQVGASLKIANETQASADAC